MNGNCRYRVGYASSQSDDSADIRRIRRLAHASDDHFFDLGRIDPGAGHQKPEGGLAQFYRIAIRQGCAGFRKWCSYTIHDVNRFFHKRPW